MAYTISVIGTGYVGLVTGVALASIGNNVTCVDIDSKKIDLLKQGKSPIFEPGLEYQLERNIEENRIDFTTDLEFAVENANLIFLCLPTPPNEDGSADLHHLLKVVSDIAGLMKKNGWKDRKILVNKSTVPVGTAETVKNLLDAELPGNNMEVISNPEFLREGFAVEDAMKPERIVVGTESEYAKKIIQDLYQPFVWSGNPILFMDVKSAEITKYAANTFLATKISFMNDLSRYCEVVGADIEKIRVGIGSDSRIGKRFLFAGIGYGGSCFPKDVRALIHSASESGTPLKIAEATHEVNHYQIERFIDKIIDRFGDKISGKSFGIWGLAFKPKTDDTREAPAFYVIDALLKHNCTLKVFDPEAIENTKLRYNDKLQYSKNPYECVDDVDALIINTEWNAFKNPDFPKMKSKMREPIIFDGRNLYSPDELDNLGFEYFCIGRRKK